MALDFPANPTNGQTYDNYYYDATVGAWNSFSSTVNTIPSTLKNLKVTTDTASTIPLTVQGVPSQTADLQQWLDSTGAIKAEVASDGTITATSLILTNDLTVSNGGTGAGTFTTGAYLKGNGTSAIQAQTGIPFADVTMQQIGAAADLDTYVTQGIYHQNSNAQAAGGANYPVALAGLLEVFQVGTDPAGFTYQRYTVYQGGHAVWTRSKYLTVWGGWQQVPVGTVTVAEGGTGATTASTALSNLGAAPLAGASFTGAISASYGGQATRISLANTTAGTDQYLSGITLANDTGYKATHFLNSSTRSTDGGVNAYTIRNDGGPLNLGNSSYTTTIYGRTLNPQQPSFYARGAETSGTLANGGDIPFNNAEVNIGGHYNTSTYRFTAPVAGMYQINTTLFNVGGTGRVSIKVNNASKYNSQNNWDTAWSWAGTIYLNANDYVTVGDWQSLGGASIYYGHSSFSGFLVG